MYYQATNFHSKTDINYSTSPTRETLWSKFAHKTNPNIWESVSVTQTEIYTAYTPIKAPKHIYMMGVSKMSFRIYIVFSQTYERDFLSFSKKIYFREIIF